MDSEIYYDKEIINVYKSDWKSNASGEDWASNDQLAKDNIRTRNVNILFVQGNLDRISSYGSYFVGQLTTDFLGINSQNQTFLGWKEGTTPS